eukprot:531422_1
MKVLAFLLSLAITSVRTAIITYYNIKLSYDEAVSYCVDRGSKLATQTEVLSYRTSVLLADIWTPVGDSYNEWLQIGNTIWPYGELHSVSVGFKPTWGTSGNKWVSELYCSGTLSPTPSP